MRKRRPSAMRVRDVALIVAAGVLLAALIAQGTAFGIIKSGERSQSAAGRWNSVSTIAYAQISAFISVDANYSTDNVGALRRAIDNGLEAASITAEDNSRLWYDAYSTEGKASIRSDYGSASVNVTAVGGDFFLLRELDFLSGWYFTDDDVMQDRVVIDGETAWALYGSYDIAGQPVSVGGKAMVIAGVVKRGEGEVYDTAYGSSPRIYMPYAAYSEINGNTAICCYEAVIPNQISGFAMSLIKSNIGVDESQLELLENSARYNFVPLCSTISGLAIRSMRTNRIIYPYWENIAGVTEDRLAVLLLGMLISGGLLAAGLFVVIVRFITTRKVTTEQLEDARDAVGDKLTKMGKSLFGKRKKEKKENGG